ncbi:MAG: flagellin FliC, partial [Proteobacteria bacterium]|nr:flagellin FliC [Pseudomonadota bacterium]
QRGLDASEMVRQRASGQLSSGLRINQAADDTAGMAVSEKLKNQVRGLNQAQRNVQDGISLLQTAEGGLTEIHSILARMRELAVQGANDTLVASDRLNINAEFTQLKAEVTRIASSVNFNGTLVLQNAASPVTLQVGANSGSTSQFTIALTNNIAGTTGQVAGTGDGLGIINQVTSNRANIGAMQNRLESASRSIAVAAENTAAANSRVADADIASAMSEMVRAQILQQAGISVLAQANQAPSLVLQLLR